MVGRIDISSLPGHLRNAVMNEIGFKNGPKAYPIATIAKYLI